ncbi:MAG: hypothetical protein KAQ85_00890 [Thermodesulfovibrionia bacterium]|nr:hypothetical protein [Thermodesulfovibrionia bacterium]
MEMNDLNVHAFILCTILIFILLSNVIMWFTLKRDVKEVIVVCNSILKENLSEESSKEKSMPEIKI